MKKKEFICKTLTGTEKFECNIIKSSSIKNPMVSIVIRTKNEEEKIEECIMKILEQKTNCIFEIIIIDSGSVDRTLEICEKYDVSIYTIPPEKFNFGTSISLGACISNGEYCIFLSAHAIPGNEYWLENMLNKFEDNVVGVYSKQTYYEDTFFIEKRSLDETFGKEKKIQKWNKNFKKYNDYKNEILFSNASSCIKKEIINENPFKKLIASEDREWAYRVIKKGYNIVYSNDSIVYHCHNESPEEYYKRIFINSKALYDFAGVEIKFYHFVPLILINVYKDILYILRNRLGLTLSKILTSIKYRYLYAKAHYLSTRDNA